ncbi:Integrase, catalytic region [sediment metagenome]|uniref:Integrase, catalytic region n=1 Tax=sediment metagenome TaxID=749907 RepID=D9PHH3_9ZZZZ
MCKTLKVSSNAYYNWIKNPKKQEDPMLTSLVKLCFEESFGIYGTRRIKKFFEKEYGWVVSRRRIAKTMKLLNIKAKAKKRFKIITTNSKHNFAISPNRIEQDFYASSPNELYVGDITYIRTKEGWLYLATVIDLFSRSVIGHAISDRLHTQIIISALNIAKSKRTTLKDAIFHSDRGSQYASDEFREILSKNGMVQSMSAKGNCYDNAVAESFFHILKTELIYNISFQTKQEARIAIEEYIRFYNTKRLHSYNDYISPFEAEIRWWLNEKSRVA